MGTLSSKHIFVTKYRKLSLVLVLTALSWILRVMILEISMLYSSIIPTIKVAPSGLKVLSPVVDPNPCQTSVHQDFVIKFKLPFVIYEEVLVAQGTSFFAVEIIFTIHLKCTNLSLVPTVFIFTLHISSIEWSISNVSIIDSVSPM